MSSSLNTWKFSIAAKTLYPRFLFRPKVALKYYPKHFYWKTSTMAWMSEGSVNKLAHILKISQFIPISQYLSLKSST